MPKLSLNAGGVRPKKRCLKRRRSLFAVKPRLFPSFFQGGFECSTHRRFDGVRLDLIESTQHDRFAALDYRALQSFGMKASRDGIRWHLIEQSPNRYDWSSALSQIRAAQITGQTVIWDVLHYGWPDFLDFWSPQWVEHFARFARAFAQVLREESDGPHFFCVVNEPSFFAFAGGTHGFFAPYSHGRGWDFKRQLVRAIVAASDQIWDVLPAARLVQTDPIVHVETLPDRLHEREMVGEIVGAQFEALDMLTGRICPELGGGERYLDVVGVNFYAQNQWFHPGGFHNLIPPSHHQYKPLNELLGWIWERYQRPVFIAETGTENEARPQWLAMIAREARAALLAGVPLEGMCIYPICNHPGWDNDRHCHNGLLDYADPNGSREVYEPLARELEIQTELMQRFFEATPYEREIIVAEEKDLDWEQLDRAARQMAGAAAL